MEEIEEWVKDQKEMINEVEKIQRGYDTQDRRKRVVKGAEGMERGTKAMETRGKRMEGKDGKQER